VVFCLANGHWWLLEHSKKKWSEWCHSIYFIQIDVCAILAKETNYSFIYLAVRSTDRDNITVPVRILNTLVRNTKVESSCRVNHNFSTVIVKSRHLLALCYHFVVSDQDVKKCCVEAVFFESRVYLFTWNGCVQIFTPNMMHATVIDWFLKFHVSICFILF